MIREQTIEYKIVSLIGLAGEVQTEELYKLKYGKEYIRKTISKLITKKYIKVYKFNNKKYLRLTVVCKRYLKEYHSDRFENMFDGASRTNKVRSDEHRRIRNHRLAEILILLDLADIKIFADEKSLMEKTLGFERRNGTDLTDYCTEKNTAEFYTADELKAAGLFRNARTSRAMGVIFSYPEAYIIYNFGDEVLEMENKTEESFFSKARLVFYDELQGRRYYEFPRIIYVGNSMELANKIMNARKGAVKKIFSSWTSYPHVLFLDTSNHAPEQLKYIINNTRCKEIRKYIDNNFEGEREWLYTTQTKDRKSEILNCTNCDLIAINLHKVGSKDITEESKKLILVCLDYQLPYMKKYFRRRDSVEYYHFESAKFYGTEDTR
ncbi:MAG: hypothetical protein II997_03455 [Clostridia bacterium]|nr:hypothetical protein [Clostridia bacterium]